MSAMRVLLAVAGETDHTLLPKGVGNSSWSQTGIIFGAIAAVALLSFLVVYCFRKKILRRHRRHHQHRPAPSAASAAQNAASDEGGKVKKRWRRSRYPRRALNPTLAQTGGLPPVRKEETPPPP
jgi:hypothetical protein